MKHTKYHMEQYRRNRGIIEWVSDCCLTPTQQYFSAESWWEQVDFQWDDDAVCFLLDQHA